MPRLCTCRTGCTAQCEVALLVVDAVDAGERTTALPLTVVEVRLKPVKNGAVNSIGCLKAPKQRGVVNCIERCG